MAQLGVLERGVNSPEDAYWLWQERGIITACSDPVRFRELCERKAGMDLTIAMWKAEIKQMQSSASVLERILAPQSIVLDLCAEFPVSWLKQIGLLDLVGLSVRQCGLRRGSKIAQKVPSL